MKELSLHILDIVQNSITAQATLISIKIIENSELNLLSIEIIDNGIGMDKDFLAKVTNPFVTTRSTRKVGLGIPLYKAAAESCNGSFFIDSTLGKGTIIKTYFERNHIDRSPIGNMAETMITLIMAKENIDYVYIHQINDKQFELDTRNIKTILEDVPISDFSVLEWLKEYINEGLKAIRQ